MPSLTSSHSIGPVGRLYSSSSTLGSETLVDRHGVETCFARDEIFVHRIQEG